MSHFRYLAKTVYHGALDWAGVYARARQKLVGQLVILTYHSFSLKSFVSFNASQPITLFRRQMNFLKRNYQVIPLQEGWRRLQMEDDTWPPFVAITIDDGFADNYQLAFLILKELSIPATIFLATDFIDNERMPWPTRLNGIVAGAKKRWMAFPFSAALTTPPEKIVAIKKLMGWLAPLSPMKRFARLDELAAHLGVGRERRIAPLSWSQIREMRDAGVAFGSHTQFHSILPYIRSEIRLEELRHSKTRIEAELGEECTLLAYPNGNYSPETFQDVAICGYRLAVTQDSGTNDANSPPLALKRIEIPCHDPFASFAGRVSLGLGTARKNQTI